MLLEDLPVELLDALFTLLSPPDLARLALTGNAFFALVQPLLHNLRLAKMQTALILDALLLSCFSGALDTTLSNVRVKVTKSYVHSFFHGGESELAFVLFPAYPLSPHHLRIQRQFSCPTGEETDAQIENELLESDEIFRRNTRRSLPKKKEKGVMCTKTNDARWVWAKGSYWWQWYYYLRSRLLSGYRLAVGDVNAKLVEWCRLWADDYRLTELQPQGPCLLLEPFPNWIILYEQISALAPYLPPRMWEHPAWNDWIARRLRAEQETAIPSLS